MKQNNEFIYFLYFFFPVNYLFMTTGMDGSCITETILLIIR